MTELKVWFTTADILQKEELLTALPESLLWQEFVKECWLSSEAAGELANQLEKALEHLGNLPLEINEQADVHYDKAEIKLRNVIKVLRGID